jgi:hypothetical protein
MSLTAWQSFQTGAAMWYWHRYEMFMLIGALLTGALLVTALLVTAL